MAESYRTYIERGNEMFYVSTIESEGGSLPMGETESPWIGETCAWEWHAATKQRGRMVFGPDYHHADLMDRHIEAIHAVVAGFAYIEDYRDALDEMFPNTPGDLISLSIRRRSESSNPEGEK